MITCIPKATADKIKEALKNRDIKIGELLDMSSAERTKFWEKYVGKDAKEVELLFEKKLVLKNVYAGLQNFINKITQSGRYNPQKIEEMKKLRSEFKKKTQERILNPKEGEVFLQELANQLAGREITEEQSKELFNLQVLSDEAFKNYNPETKTWSSKKAKYEYGSARTTLENYTDYLEEGGTTLKGLLQERLALYKSDVKEKGTTRATWELLTDTIKTLSDSSIAMVASFDNSFMGRQGLNTLMTNPKIWHNFSRRSFSDFFGTLKGQAKKDAMWADIFSDPMYIDGTMDKAKILPKSEEQYPTTLPMRIPVLGNILKASEQAFTGSALRARIALLRHHLEVSKKNGVEITDGHIESLGKMVNSLTARGQWGKRGEPGIVRILLWAPKMLKGNIDVLTGMQFVEGVDARTKKIAAQNLIKIVGITALTMMIAEAMGAEVEDDPRSTDFGKIVVGNTRFDITGGKASIITLAMRIARNSYKSTKTGEIIKYGSGYGDKTRFDILVDFLTNKAAPPTRVVIDLMKGKNFRGEKVTVPNILYSLTTPISVKNAIELKDDNSAQAVLGVLLDAIGINTNTYIEFTDWETSTGKVNEAFKEAVGDKKFKEANNTYNERLQEWWNAVKVDVRYQELTPEVKQKVITNKKTALKEDIMKEYGFKYKKDKPVKVPKL